MNSASLRRTTLVGPAIPLLLTLAIASLPAAILLNDDFSAAARVGTAPSVTGVSRSGGTTNDYVVATNGNSSMATGTPNNRAGDVIPGINGNSFVVTNEASAYSITTAFPATTLTPGDSLSLTFNMRTSTAAPAAGGGAFRFGMFNSLGTASSIPTANTNAFSGNGAFEADTGYVSNYTTTTGGMTGQLQERTGGTNAQNVFQGTYATLGTSPDAGPSAISFDINYTATLTLTLSLDGATITADSAFNGLSLSRTDAITPVKTFDSLSIFFASQFGSATTVRQNFIDDVVVTYTPVPEASFAALSSFALLGFLRRRR